MSITLWTLCLLVNLSLYYDNILASRSSERSERSKSSKSSGKLSKLSNHSSKMSKTISRRSSMQTSFNSSHSDSSTESSNVLREWNYVPYVRLHDTYNPTSQELFYIDKRTYEPVVITDFDDDAFENMFEQTSSKLVVGIYDGLKYPIYVHPMSYKNLSDYGQTMKLFRKYNRWPILYQYYNVSKALPVVQQRAFIKEDPQTLCDTVAQLRVPNPTEIVVQEASQFLERFRLRYQEIYLFGKGLFQYDREDDELKQPYLTNSTPFCFFVDCKIKSSQGEKFYYRVIPGPRPRTFWVIKMTVSLSEPEKAFIRMYFTLEK